MKLVPLFAFGFFGFVLGSLLSYMPALKNSQYYYPMWFAVSVLAAWSWAMVARVVPDSTELVRVGLYWDTLMQLTYLIIPIACFGARLTLLQSAGVALIFTGLMMTRG